jgi:hypothetical protein
VVREPHAGARGLHGSAIFLRPSALENRSIVVVWPKLVTT